MSITPPPIFIGPSLVERFLLSLSSIILCEAATDCLAYGVRNTWKCINFEIVVEYYPIQILSLYTFYDVNTWRPLVWSLPIRAQI